MSKNKIRGRIRYDKEYNFGNTKQEAYVFEIEHEDGSYGLDTAFPLVNDMIHYTGLTKIRHWMDLDIEFWFE